VIAWSPYSKSDIALILYDSTDTPDPIHPLLLYEVRAVRGRQFRAYGFPKGYNGGLWAHGTLEQFLISSGQIQINSGEIVPGYSGAPIQDLHSGRVIGMISACDLALGKAFAIPATTIQSVINTTSNRQRIEVRSSRRDFDYLTRGMERLPDDPMSGVELFLREYLGTPKTVVPFGGRSCELQSLDDWLKEPEQPFGIIAAPAGRGKSALLSRWAAKLATEERALVAFVPLSNRFRTSLKSQTVALWGARLEELSGVSERSSSAHLTRDSAQWLGEIGATLRDGNWDPERPLVNILDGLDEAADWDPARDLPIPPDLPVGVKILVSARLIYDDKDSLGWIARLRWSRNSFRLELPYLTRDGVAEILDAMGNPLANLSSNVDLIEELHRLSDGDPLIVRLFVDGLRTTADRQGFLRPEDLARIKPGLQDFFDAWWADQIEQWQREGKDPDVWEGRAMTVLQTLSCALGPISSVDLQAVCPPESGLADERSFRQTIRALRRFVVGDGSRLGFAFAHPRLSDFFFAKLDTRAATCLLERYLVHCRTTFDAVQKGKVMPAQASSYVVQFYGAHLDRIHADPNRYPSLVNLDEYSRLLSRTWLSMWVETDRSLNGFSRDLDRVWTTAERNHDTLTELKCALYISSISARNSDLPPALFGEAVAEGLLPPSQALAMVRQLRDDEQRCWALCLLVPKLDRVQQARGIEIVSESRNVYLIAPALLVIAGSLSVDARPGVLQTCMDYITIHCDIQSHVQLVQNLYPLLPDFQRDKAATMLLAALKQLPFGADRGSRQAWAIAQDPLRFGAKEEIQCLLTACNALSHRMVFSALRNFTDPLLRRAYDVGLVPPIHPISIAEQIQNVLPALQPETKAEILRQILGIDLTSRRDLMICALGPHLSGIAEVMPDIFQADYLKRLLLEAYKALSSDDYVGLLATSWLDPQYDSFYIGAEPCRDIVLRSTASLLSIDLVARELERYRMNWNGATADVVKRANLWATLLKRLPTQERASLLKQFINAGRKAAPETQIDCFAEIAATLGVEYLDMAVTLIRDTHTNESAVRQNEIKLKAVTRLLALYPDYFDHTWVRAIEPLLANQERYQVARWARANHRYLPSKCQEILNSMTIESGSIAALLEAADQMQPSRRLQILRYALEGATAIGDQAAFDAVRRSSFWRRPMLRSSSAWEPAGTPVRTALKPEPDLSRDLLLEAKRLLTQSITSDWAPLFEEAARRISAYPNELSQVAAALWLPRELVGRKQCSVFLRVFGSSVEESDSDILENLQHVEPPALRSLLAAALIRQVGPGPTLIKSFCDSAAFLSYKDLAAALPVMIGHISDEQVGELLKHGRGAASEVVLLLNSKELSDRDRRRLSDALLETPAESWSGAVDLLPKTFLEQAIPAIRRLSEDAQMVTLMRVAKRFPSLREKYLAEAFEVATGASHDRKRAEYLLILAPGLPEKVWGAAERISAYYRLPFLCDLMEVKSIRREAIVIAIFELLQRVSSGRAAAMLQQIGPHLREYGENIRDPFAVVFGRLLRGWAREPRPAFLNNIEMVVGAAVAVFGDEFATKASDVLDEVQRSFP
jgi:hypothetical protein